MRTENPDFAPVDAKMLRMDLKITFKQVEAFRAVMASGSVVGAAKLMNVTQPGVSRTIGLLEMRLGYALFDRVGRRLLPTPEGKALYREVERLYGGLGRIEQVAQDIRFQRVGALRVATLPALAQSVVPRAVARFLATRPKVSVFVQSLPSRQIAELVSTQQFDIGIVEMPLSHPAPETEPLCSSRMVAAMTPSHRLAGRRRISIKELDGERMVMMSQHSFVRYLIEDSFAKCGAAPDIVAETPNSLVACALAAEGAGVTLVSTHSVSVFANQGLATCELEEELFGRYALMFPQLTSRMSMADAFAQTLREQFADPELGTERPV